MNLKEKLATLPLKPGCYLMKDKDGKVIYVGKAIKLKNRVNSYFVGAHNYKTTKLVSNIADFDYIVTKSEKEALILEYNLIKEYDPKFNIVFKDDKSYPYIVLKDSPEPFCSVVHLNKKNRQKGKIFGPYTNVTAARNTLDLINKLFPTRKCANLQNETCLYYHLHNCPGYCIKKIDESESQKCKEQIISFLGGNTSEVIKDLKGKMDAATEKLDFENAARYRDLIRDINASVSKQDVQKNNKESFDVFNYYAEDGYIAVTGLFVRKGKLLFTHKHIDALTGDIDNFFSAYLYNFYEHNELPKKLFIPKDCLTFLENSLDTEVLSVNRGYKYQLLKQARLNSEENLKQKKNVTMRSYDYLDSIDDEFKRIFGKSMDRIELFDNSHTSGTNTVAGMVVYENYKPAKKEYRLYKLEDGADDLKSMHEVLYRRYFRVLKDNLRMPDLLIVDGALNQIREAKEIISSLGLEVTIIGLGKDRHHNTSYMMDSDFNKIEIDPKSNFFFFLTNMQDEVHRFAITYHRKLRSKSSYRSVLDDIKGLGPKSKTKLLRKYKSVSEMKGLSIDELSTVLNRKTAEELYNKLQEESNVKELQ